MKWAFMGTGFIAEVMDGDHPVLLSVEPFAEHESEAAAAYGQEVWEGLTERREALREMALYSLSLKNEHWLEMDEQPFTEETILPYLNRIAGVYARSDEGIMVYFEVGELFAGNSVVVMLTPSYSCCGIQIM
ncbi:MAG: hypothetical protein MR209_04845 [Veillonellaceae bacterium]|nr:hypothetical protein [Veillonellaceae bacterium]